MTRKPLNVTYDVEAYEPSVVDGGVVREQNVPSEAAALTIAHRWAEEGFEVDVQRREYFDHSDIRYTLVETIRAFKEMTPGEGPVTRWLCLSATGDVLRACVADDIGEARTLLRTTLAAHRGSYVQSAISHALRVNPFKRGDRCPGGCGGMARSGGRICVPCRNRQAARVRWGEGRGAQRTYVANNQPEA